MLHLTQTQRLQQKLSPAQVQYLKILQLPVMALEQRIKDELEINPLLEEGMEQEELQEELDDTDALLVDDTIVADTGTLEEAAPVESSAQDDYIEKEIREHQDDEYSWEEFFENNEGAAEKNYYDQDDDREIPTPATVTMSERLVDQLRMLDLDDRLMVLGEEIIGNIEDDGYLRRNIKDLVLDINLETGHSFTQEEGELVLQRILRLDPPGIGSRNLRECLLVQLELMPNTSTARIIAMRILRECYTHFVKKHFDKIQQELHITQDMLRKAFEVIMRLNPKPGEGTITSSFNYIVPDFFVTRDKDDFIITLNDRGVPPLRVSREYKELLTNRRSGLNTETKQFLRQKMESAKWFIQSINQRRHTMIGVMHTIVNKQRQWFDHGPGHLRPLIYKDIADVISMDISTISRVVNGKYVQTEWGVHELRYFFSEGIPTASGIEVSNTEVKNIIKDIISAEDARKPLSDEAIMKILRERGYDIAKYREALGIPVSRLRVTL